MKATLLIGITYSQRCPKLAIRKEIRSLSEKELNDWSSAVKELYKKGIMDQFSNIHHKNSLQSHGVPAFLPWHRRYLRNFELELQKINPTIILPYWNWLLDFEKPHQSIVLSDGLLGGEGKKEDNYCVKNGLFKELEINYPTKHCLKRQYSNLDGTMPRFAEPLLIEQFKSYKSFGNFSFALEVVHGYVHTGIGGYEGDFTPHYSPNDPLFMLHHAFIDKIWWEWQTQHMNHPQYNGETYNKRVTVLDSLQPFGVSVKSTLDIYNIEYCYAYDDMPDQKAQIMESVNKTVEARPLNALDLSFLQLNKINAQKANQTLQKAELDLKALDELLSPLTSLLGLRGLLKNQIKGSRSCSGSSGSRCLN